MKRTRAQMKAEMMREAEERINRLLDWQEGSKKPTLSRIEDEVLAARQELSEGLVRALLSGEEAGEPSEAPRCPECGQAMENKGKQPKLVESRVGELVIERNYYYCAKCGVGLFPPG
jgi:peptide subunit release factor 1 (eRF1)